MPLASKRVGSQAISEIGRAEAYRISAAAEDDRAPIRTGTDGIARLRSLVEVTPAKRARATASRRRCTAHCWLLK